jgi:hypothetical protein
MKITRQPELEMEPADLTELPQFYTKTLTDKELLLMDEKI